MPHWIIYHPPNTFQDVESKQALARDITLNYTRAGLPAFYVVMTFIQVPDSSQFIGGELAHTRGKPFIRIAVWHIHVNVGAHIDSDEKKHTAIMSDMCDRLDTLLKPHIADKGYDWEYHIDETDRRLWRLNGLDAPPWKSADERTWVHHNRAVPPEEMEAARTKIGSRL